MLRHTRQSWRGRGRGYLRADRRACTRLPRGGWASSVDAGPPDLPADRAAADQTRVYPAGL